MKRVLFYRIYSEMMSGWKVVEYSEEDGKVGDTRTNAKDPFLAMAVLYSKGYTEIIATSMSEYIVKKPN